MDLRSEPRVPHHIRLIAHVSQCPEAPELVGESLACEGIDFSTHGLQFATTRSLPPGSTVNITVAIGEPFAMFLLRGEIRWVRDADGEYFMGTLLHDTEGTDYGDWCERFDEVFS